MSSSMANQREKHFSNDHDGHFMALMLEAKRK
jgi:hypothetical protein